MADDSEAESIADGIFGSVSYEAPEPETNRPFLPWHRPRKQFVRYAQWKKEILALLPPEPGEGQVLKYLGLPGVDLLDLRYIHDSVCLERNISMRFLGFVSEIRSNESAHVELNLSLAEVMDLPHVDVRSSISQDRFELLGNQSSVAFKHARTLGPYDVVNIDLCDGFGARAPSKVGENYYLAVTSILGMQARTHQPWLLFLTTRADRECIDDEVLTKLIGKYVENLQSSAEFARESSDKFGVSTADDVERVLGTVPVPPSDLLPLFLTSLCKWFVGLALNQLPPVHVSLRSVIGYRVKGTSECEDLVSLAFRFEPQMSHVVDPLNVARGKQSTDEEGRLACQALRGVVRRVDADLKLRENAALREKMVDGSAALLELARYDANAYRVWATTSEVLTRPG